MNKDKVSTNNLFTNTDSDVFIPLVPSVLGAMLMSKVSRQKEGFRDDLIKMVSEDMINIAKDNQLEQFKNSVVVANGFMEKWGVNFGHSSIKELDTLQMCLENKSRWFTEILETLLPAKYMSYIEYSLRYNPPKNYYIPHELQENNTLLQKYKEFSDRCFEVYHEIYHDFYEILKERYAELPERELKLKAFENARNVLPLSTLANMGMQSNLRAFCDALAQLFAHEGFNQEVVDAASSMKREGEKYSVGMVKHVEPTEYLKSFVKDFYKRCDVKTPYLVFELPYIASSSEISGDIKQLENFGDLSKLGRFDRLPDMFRNIGKYMIGVLSEGAHHQLIRHRAIDFVTYMPDPRFGLVMPYELSKQNPRNQNAHRQSSEAQFVQAAREKIMRMYEMSCTLYEEFVQQGYLSLAPYVVINANAREVKFFANLFSMTNFITLRKEAHAQDEIRNFSADLESHLIEFEKLIKNFRFDLNQNHANETA